MGSNPQLCKLILGLKNDLFLSKSHKNICICTKLIPKAKKFKKWKIYSEPLQDTVVTSLKLTMWLTICDNLNFFFVFLKKEKKESTCFWLSQTAFRTWIRFSFWRKRKRQMWYVWKLEKLDQLANVLRMYGAAHIRITKTTFI